MQPKAMSLARRRIEMKLKLLDIRAEKREAAKENAREERPTSWTPLLSPHKLWGFGRDRENFDFELQSLDNEQQRP
ncbi:hypothetical protein TNCV_3754501 [Trichonephila clavipes]|nr:hypothetical protein TNCV_3754501 [Trichonephila clavipes]